MIASNLLFRFSPFAFRFFLLPLHPNKPIPEFMKKSRVFLLALILMPFLSFSQILEPVKWTFKVEQTKPGEATLLMISNSERGWHTYSQEVIPDGPVPTEFTFTKSPDYELNGKVIEPKGVKENDIQMKMVLTFFPDKAIFRQKIKVLGKKDFTIKGSVYFMCCNDRSCIAPTDVAFEFAIKGNPGASAQPQQVTNTPQQTGNTAAISATAGKPATDTNCTSAPSSHNFALIASIKS